MAKADVGRPRGGFSVGVLCRSIVAAGLASVLLLVALTPPCQAAEGASPRPLSIVVMDPLAEPLACACVEGFAQRKYEVLGAYLQLKLGRKVDVVFAEDLARAIRLGSSGRVDLIIGKQSMVKWDAAERKLDVRPLAMLTDPEGRTTLTGIFVVPGTDPAQSLADLAGYRVLFGPADSDEKRSAAIAALKKAGVAVPEKPETFPSCSDAAFAALDHEGPPGAAAVISSYAMALMEGCGKIEKGMLRAVGHTEPVPFVTVFATAGVTAEAEKQIVEALLAFREHPAFLTALESKNGFVPIESKSEEADPKESAPKKGDATSTDWPGWRGPNRDGICPWLPETLPPVPKIRWQTWLTGAGLAGIVATDRYVIVADRDALDQFDVFRCLSADMGEPAWVVQYPAPGELDYGNSPRATPLIHQGKVYLLGAFGDLHCVNLADGETVWQRNVNREFHAKLVTWGMCSSPLVVDDKLIVNPGGQTGSLVALDRLTGKTLWQSPGLPCAYSSFIVATLGGVRQIVGYDAISLGGWDPATGKRLWQLVPPEEGDFNVPTPIALDGKLLVTTENNGTRLYAFDGQGRIVTKPLAENLDLAPDSSTPVVIDGKVYGCSQGLFCLDLDDGLKSRWIGDDEAFEDYVAVIGNRHGVLIVSARGELVLVRANGEKYELVSRVRIFGEDSEVLSHPALANKRIYIRDGLSICCVELE